MIDVGDEKLFQQFDGQRIAQEVHEYCVNEIFQIGSMCRHHIGVFGEKLKQTNDILAQLLVDRQRLVAAAAAITTSLHRVFGGRQAEQERLFHVVVEHENARFEFVENCQIKDLVRIVDTVKNEQTIMDELTGHSR